MPLKALVVGGTAATGPYIVSELLRRGYETTIYHRGRHEVPLPSAVRHIHGEPHFADSIESDLGGSTWDLVVATYGRIRFLADYFQGRTQRLITVGGWPVLRGWFHVRDAQFARHAAPVMLLAPEDHPYEDPGVDPFVDRMIETERAVVAHHEAGSYAATHIRYPQVYGPWGVRGFEPEVIRRVLDGRRTFVIGDGGQQLTARCAAPNAAHAIGLVIDNPDAAGGRIYHVLDDRQFTRRQWVERIAVAAGHEFEFFDIPYELAPPGALPAREGNGGVGRYHRLPSSAKIKVELGYEDLVAPEEWLIRSVEWALAHPPTADLRNEYAIEDALVEQWSTILESFAPLNIEVPQTRHPYAHPRRIGDPT